MTTWQRKPGRSQELSGRSSFAMRIRKITRRRVLAAGIVILGICAGRESIAAGPLPTAVIDSVMQQVTQAIDANDAQRAQLSKPGANGTVPEKNKERLKRLDEAHANLDSAQELLKNGTPPPPERLRPVKEIVRWLSRKVWVACHGRPWLSEDGQRDFGDIIARHQNELRSASLATGLVKVFDRADKESGRDTPRGVIGTAVAVGTRRLITNKHVILEGHLGYEDSNKTIILYKSPFARVEFPVEYDRCPMSDKTDSSVEIDAVEYSDPTLDFVVVHVTADVLHTVEFPQTVDVVTGDRLAVIGYPTRPGDTDTFLTASQIDLIFSAPDGRTPFPAQRIAEGETMFNDEIERGYFRYDATTWGGNSGSIVVNLVNGQIIGLHARGLQAKDQGSGYNEGVSAPPIAVALKDLQRTSQ